jgi:hypothetical protein
VGGDHSSQACNAAARVPAVRVSGSGGAPGSPADAGARRCRCSRGGASPPRWRPLGAARPCRMAGLPAGAAARGGALPHRQRDAALVLAPRGCAARPHHVSCPGQPPARRRHLGWAPSPDTAGAAAAAKACRRPGCPSRERAAGSAPLWRCSACSKHLRPPAAPPPPPPPPSPASASYATLTDKATGVSVPLATLGRPAGASGAPRALFVFAEHCREVITSEVGLWLGRLLVDDHSHVRAWPELHAALERAGERPAAGADWPATLHAWARDLLQRMTIQVGRGAGRRSAVGRGAAAADAVAADAAPARRRSRWVRAPAWPMPRRAQSPAPAARTSHNECRSSRLRAWRAAAWWRAARCASARRPTRTWTSTAIGPSAGRPRCAPHRGPVGRGGAAPRTEPSPRRSPAAAPGSGQGSPGAAWQSTAACAAAWGRPARARS